jgi:hypothetical protein
LPLVCESAVIVKTLQPAKNNRIIQTKYPETPSKKKFLIGERGGNGLAQKLQKISKVLRLLGKNNYHNMAVSGARST